MGIDWCKEVGTPEGDAVDDRHTACEVVATEVFFFFDVRPFGTAPCLVMEDTLTELVVPDVGRCHIDGVRSEGEGKAFGILAFARALAASNEDDTFHGGGGDGGDGVDGVDGINGRGWVRWGGWG